MELGGFVVIVFTVHSNLGALRTKMFETAGPYYKKSDKIASGETYVVVVYLMQSDVRFIYFLFI